MMTTQHEELCAVIDAAFKRAVDGELRAVIVVTITPSNEVQLTKHGLTATEVVGTLNLCQNIEMTLMLRSLRP
jgi:hypothetical protein